MRLHQRLVHEFESGLLFLGADGLDERREREVACRAQAALACPRNERERLRRERVVRQPAAIELAQHEGLHRIRGELAHRGGVGEARVQILIHREPQRAEHFGLAEEHDVVVLRELLEQKPQPPQAIHRHQMRVVDQHRQRLARPVQRERLIDQLPLDLEVATLELDLEGLAEDADRVVIGVQRPAHRRRHELSKFTTTTDTCGMLFAAMIARKSQSPLTQWLAPPHLGGNPEFQASKYPQIKRRRIALCLDRQLSTNVRFVSGA